MGSDETQAHNISLIVNTFEVVFFFSLAQSLASVHSAKKYAFFIFLFF